MDALKKGEGILIFSQGTRMEGFENAKGGVAVFALKTGAPIVPVGIRSSYKLFSKIHIHFGEPIPLDEFAGQKVKTELIDRVMSIVMTQVSELANKA
jgi:1-acyl-sn-glycerol-3-phosphate acyltransferase